MILFCDPGRSTGLAWGYYDKDTPFTLEGYAQVDGGLLGLLIWLGDNKKIADGHEWFAEYYKPYAAIQTIDSMYPKYIEGSLVTLGYMDDYDLYPANWRTSNYQYVVSGKNAAEKKSKQNAWIKAEHPELYVTGKMVGQKDADDVRSAIGHILSILRDHKHLPTIRKYWPEDAENPRHVG